MDEKILEKIKRLAWGDIKKAIAAKQPFEAISPMGSMLIRIQSYDQPVVALMPHTGHHVREEILSKMSIEEDDRATDEDARLTGLVAEFPIQVFGLDSRYEYDLDRKKDDAIYLKPFQCWGKKVWVNPPSKDEIEVSLQKYDEFHDLLDYLYDEFLKINSKLVVVHVQGVTPKAGTKISTPYQIDVDTSLLESAQLKQIDVFMNELKTASPNSHQNGGTKVSGQLAKIALQKEKVLPISLGVGRPLQELPTPLAVAKAMFKAAKLTADSL